ncbi:gonadotropin-releasing hormone II receptor [Trichonephila clavata]|uniref:Gonadotropin-releasing hormone II receptor n=1 Tax=Trichonephila clavata TaxID=2740835 RepID=A0A8X6K9E0_TRICU|nr:gonadotropin-releasing hormone II receptor [Trichonephila clavata]
MAVQRRQIGMLELSEFDFEEHYFNGTNNSYNGSLSIGYQELSYYFFSNQDSFCEVALYSLMFVVAAIGNMTVFVTLIRYRHRKSRMNLMILHVAIADLIVTFIMTPLEIIRRASFQWVVGNPACQILLPTRAFGPYLSSLILVCISLDRYFTFLYPEKINYAQRRGKIMLELAWITSILITILQVSCH